MIKNILFDLDGTMLPMDMEKFTHGYFKRLVAKAASRGYEPEKLIKSVWAGTAAMVKTCGALPSHLPVPVALGTSSAHRALACRLVSSRPAGTAPACA